jgi:hypothetical protein
MNVCLNINIYFFKYVQRAHAPTRVTIPPSTTGIHTALILFLLIVFVDICGGKATIGDKEFRGGGADEMIEFSSKYTLRLYHSHSQAVSLNEFTV